MITDEEFRLFRNLIYEESGIYFKEGKKDFLDKKIVKRMSSTNSRTPYRYYRFLTANRTSELLLFLDLLTINETSFFRNGPQFKLLGTAVLPEIMKAKEPCLMKNLRIWSAGCSTGEEPYSIAMTVLDAIPHPEAWDIRIFASDMSLRALEAANNGEYAAARVEATVEPPHIGRYFRKTGDRYRVADALRKMVIFDYHNMKNDNGLRELDIIFCRNVMIYFDEGEQRRLVDKFYQSLNPGGYLFLGHAESLYGWGTGFQFVHDEKGSAYKKSTQGGYHENPDRGR